MYSGYLYKGNLSFPELELNLTGIYSIEYYYHFNCNLTSCLNSNASITIYFEYENIKTSIKHKNTDNNRNSAWIKNTLNITTTIKNKLKVISIYILNSIATQSFFDHIQQKRGSHLATQSIHKLHLHDQLILASMLEYLNPRFLY